MAQKIIGEDGKVHNYKSKKPFYKKWWFILLVILIVLGVISNKNKETTTETPESKQAQSSKIKEETKKEELKTEAKATEVDKSITTKEQKRLVTFLENADNRYYDNFKEILTAFDTQDFDKTKRLLNRYEEKLSGIYDDVLNYECKPTGNPNFDKECGELSQSASEEYTLKNNVIIELRQFFKDPNQMTLENVRTQFKYVLEKSEELRDKYAIFKNKNF